jgi:hypothetical protein
MRAVVAVVALAAAALLTACGTARTSGNAVPVTPSARTSPSTAAAPRLVMIIRHGEKPDGSQPGLDANGNEDSSSLTATGWDRAHRLVDLFDPPNGALRAGLGRPTAIYAAGANDDGEGTRTRETVTPLADALGLPVNTDYGKGDEEKLVKHVTDQPGPTLICWQHGEIPGIVDAFPAVSPKPPSQWPDDRFDVIWTLTETPDGWTFAQLPELVLPQDSPDVIED